LNGSWFADLLFKADLLSLDYKTSFQGSKSNTDSDSLGVRLDTGYRFNTGPGLFLEPQATIAWVNTELDRFALLNATVNPHDGESVRGRLGLRGGTSWQSANMIVEPFVMGSVWHEFEGDNQASLTSGAITLAFKDQPSETYGEVGGGLNVFNSTGNVSGFAKVDWLVGGDLEGVSGKVGGRVAW